MKLNHYKYQLNSTLQVPRSQLYKTLMKKADFLTYKIKFGVLLYLPK
jgi:hypothetical protein